MTRPLLLVGAGGLAREVLAAARALGAPVLGMLDDDAARYGTTVDGVPVLGGLDLVHDHSDAAVLLCVANPARPAGRAAVAARLGLPDERYATLVHPAASVAHGAELGAGTVLLAGAVITAPQRVGRHVLAMPHVLMTHDDEVGDHATLAGRATLAGNVTVGESAYLGAGALVRQGVHIGTEAVVGMGAVVLADVPARQTWAGVPARLLKENP
ncbi:acetyltransferase [Actinokineospora sp. UTMC 2448]|uniref:acetyltransferase n=1 Tax=Actinokineospora sp. UTMC 2448 TaxID=2268449 RepID=UPI002164212B|nr:acetyltransferase [Actinokineospora sp. UTMC 2448]UVS82401.1 Putative acetyltransferase EpsM [Actinokineospora sp. UTMC 2448]